MLNTIKKFFIKNMSLSVKIAVLLLLTGFSINNVFADTDIIPSKVNITQINGTYYGTMRIAEPKDTAEVLKKAGTTVAGVALGVPGLSQGIAVAKGLISPNDNESRMQSAGKNLYESTPLPLVNKGIDFYAPQDSLVVLSLKKK